MADPGADQPDMGEPQFAAHAITEPIFVVSVMIASCYFNRRRGYRISRSDQDLGLLGNAKPDPLDDDDLSGTSDEQDLFELSPASTTHPRKKRDCCGAVFYTPNSSRYANHWHSRVIQRFPFLVEMFYWILNYAFYICAKPLTEMIFAGDSDALWKAAESHGASILKTEHEGFFSFMFPLREVDVQQFFMNGHQGMLTVLNRGYSLIHIPVTVSFLAWYYYSAPTHAQFATVRRMMTLTNFFSFAIFAVYPCMPPRLMPAEYGFFDTVRREDAESVWASGKFFNQLAAFPSLHFGYSFCIATALMYHSGVFRRRLAHREKRISRLRQVVLVALSVIYPAFVLTIIVSTANHYWLDALASSGVVLLAWLCNRVFMVLLPLEDMFLWCVKLEKPIPTTGDRGP